MYLKVRCNPGYYKLKNMIIYNFYISIQNVTLRMYYIFLNKINEAELNLLLNYLLLLLLLY